MTSSSTELARAVVSALVEAWVREVVVAPGSRNAPLTFAAFDARTSARFGWFSNAWLSPSMNTIHRQCG